MIALFIIGYLVAGIVVARAFGIFEPLEPSQAAAVVLLWPIYVTILALILLLFVLAVAAGVRRW